MYLSRLVSVPSPYSFIYVPLNLHMRGACDTKPLPVSGRRVNDTILQPCFSHNRRIEKKYYSLESCDSTYPHCCCYSSSKAKKLRKEVTKVQCHSQQTAQFLGTYFPFPFFQGTFEGDGFFKKKKTFLESLSTGIEFVWRFRKGGFLGCFH